MQKEIFKYTHSDEGTILIALQINIGESWSKTPATFHRVPGKNGAIYAQLLANMYASLVRLTYPRNQYEDVSRYNGAYIYPGNTVDTNESPKPDRSKILVEIYEGDLQYITRTGPQVDLYIVNWDKAEAEDAKDEDKAPMKWCGRNLTFEKFEEYRTELNNKHPKTKPPFHLRAEYREYLADCQADTTSPMNFRDWEDVTYHYERKNA